MGKYCHTWLGLLHLNKIVSGGKESHRTGTRPEKRKHGVCVCVCVTVNWSVFARKRGDFRGNAGTEAGTVPARVEEKEWLVEDERDLPP